jgi:hypothetical protein
MAERKLIKPWPTKTDPIHAPAKAAPPSTRTVDDISRMLAHVTQDVPFAMLTAFRGECEVAENESRNEDLRRHLRSMNIRFSHVSGSFADDGSDAVTQRLFFVIRDSVPPLKPGKLDKP